MRRMKRGFTIIELLVVISVIGILATITLVGFNRYQADSRDSQRLSKATIISEALEKYYDKNGEYPGCSALTDVGTNVATNVLVGTDPKVFIAPQAASNQTNSIDLCTTLASNYPTDSFAYVGDGSGPCTTGNSCLSYTLQYKEESTGLIKSISSRRTTDILTSGDIANLNASVAGFDRVNLTWTDISGAASYDIQWKYNANDFATPTGNTTSTTTSPQVTGLSVGSLYYFRVRPVSSTGVPGNWSNVDSATTTTLNAPVCTAIPTTAAPSSQVQCSWPNVPNATSYTIQYADNNAFTGATATTVPNATSPYVVSGLGVGVTRYFRVKALASGFESAWSNTDNATTGVPIPSTPSIAWAAGNNNGSTTTNAVTCSLGTARYSRATTYRTDGSTAENFSAWSAWQTTTSFGDFITGEGMFGIAKVRAECLYSGFESNPVESAVITKKRPITSISASTAVARSTSPGLIAVYGGCASGTNSMYIYGRIYHGSAGTNAGGGWGAGSGFQITNTGWSYSDANNVYRVSRTICQTPYWETSTYSGVPGGTLQNCCGATGLNDYNNFMGAGYGYSVAR